VRLVPFGSSALVAVLVGEVPKVEDEKVVEGSCAARCSVVLSGAWEPETFSLKMNGGRISSLVVWATYCWNAEVWPVAGPEDPDARAVSETDAVVTAGAVTGTAVTVGSPVV
jgi:hypothetical protein